MSRLARIRVEREAEFCIVGIEGEIDASNSAELRERLLDEARGLAGGLVVDLSETGYLDSTGIAMLLEVAERLGDRQQRLGLAVAPGSFVAEVLAATGLPELLAIRHSTAKAVSSLAANAGS